MTESNFEKEMKRRANQRLIGACVLVLLSLSLLPFLFRPAPPAPQNGVIINFLRPNVNTETFNLPTLPQPILPESPDNESTASPTERSSTAPLPSGASSAWPNNNKDSAPPPSIEENQPRPKNSEEAHYLATPYFSDVPSLSKVSKSLTQANIKFKTDKGLSDAGKIETRLILGPFASPSIAMVEQKKIMSSIRDIKSLSVLTTAPSP